MREDNTEEQIQRSQRECVPTRDDLDDFVAKMTCQQKDYTGDYRGVD